MADQEQKKIQIEDPNKVCRHDQGLIERLDST